MHLTSPLSVSNHLRYRAPALRAGGAAWLSLTLVLQRFTRHDLAQLHVLSRGPAAVRSRPTGFSAHEPRSPKQYGRVDTQTAPCSLSRRYRNCRVRRQFASRWTDPVWRICADGRSSAVRRGCIPFIRRQPSRSGEF